MTTDHPFIRETLRQLNEQLLGTMQRPPHWPKTFMTNGLGLYYARRFFGFTEPLGIHCGRWIPEGFPAVVVDNSVYVSQPVYDQLTDPAQSDQVFNSLEVIVMASGELKDIFSDKAPFDLKDTQSSPLRQYGIDYLKQRFSLS